VKMAECSHCGKDGKPTLITDKVGELVYQKVEVCLCGACEALYQAKDVQFMQWLVVHRGAPAR
jgi:hypothetical protein